MAGGTSTPWVASRTEKNKEQGDSVGKPVIIGDAELWLGDCMDMWNDLPGDAILITDPPYGLGKKLSGGSWGATAEHKEVLEWDAFAPQSMVTHLTAKYPISVVWGGNYFLLPPSRGWLIWDKANAVPTAADCEMAWTSLDKNTKRYRAPVEPHKYGHPTEKPLGLMAWCIEQIGGTRIIFDPFMGSGTTGVAAIQLGRKFIGIERDERYFEIACRRIEQAVAQGQLFAPEPVKQVQESFL
jgi:site-specific DNA-methyltransferase (adenine-specific)/modification methylase